MAMPVPHYFPQVPSHIPQGPHSPYPMNPHSSYNVSDTDLTRDMRGGRSRLPTNDGRKRSRSSSTPPENRYNHNPNRNSQPPPGYSQVSADGSRAWAQNQIHGWSTGNVEANVQVQGQGMVQVGMQPGTQFVAQLGPRNRRSSFGHPPGQTLISSPVIPPFAPGVTTNVAHVPNRLRRDSYRRPRILFYHRHEPHYGFTNFSDHPVTYGGKKYPTSEHLFQSFKVWFTVWGL